MPNNLFRKANAQLEHTNRYEVFGFVRNPFPSKPSVTIGSPNPVENGTIYLSEIREREQEVFEELLIPHPNRPQAKGMAFLMDYASRRGRGIGKTAFLYQQNLRIMSDFGAELSKNSQVLFSVYITPSSNETRKFWQFSKLILEAMTDQKIVAQAIWRLRAFSGLIPEDALDEVGSDPELTIGNEEWLREKKVDVSMVLSHAIRVRLQKLDVDSKLIDALVKFGHSPENFQRYFLEKISDHEWKRREGRILFDDIVKILIEAGFTKGILLCDEMEKIIQKQNPKERREFAESLRYFFLDGLCESAKMSFFNVFMTIHPYSQELLNPHWAAAGLDRFADLSGELVKEYTVYFYPLDEAMAIPLAKAYIDAARIPGKENKGLYPFEKEALTEALMKAGRVPGKFLILLYLSIEKAVQEGWEKIDAAKIKKLNISKPPQEPIKQERRETITPSDIQLLSDGDA